VKQFPWPVVLASASPRRQELLRALLPDFTVDPADIDEDALTHADPDLTARTLAREKAIAVAARHPDSLIIAGDTVVALPEGTEWHQLTKPTDTANACHILRQLAGRTHHVITGICLRWPGGMSVFAESSRVTFRALTETEISNYVATGEPMDKAGAYGLQGGAKGFVAKIEGSVTNVIGLPVERLKEALAEIKPSRQERG